MKDTQVVVRSNSNNSKKEELFGYIIGIFHQYAHICKGRTIHSANQMRKWGVLVNDNPRSTGGLQQICTSKGHIIPLSI
jgi:hypothetical protein